MTAVLLDTHVVLWLVAGPDRLGPSARAMIQSGPAWVSSASLWELAVKQRAGKLTLDADLASGLSAAGVRELPVTWAHAGAYAEIDLPQRDPFDILLVAQAQTDRLTLITADRAILGAGLPGVVDARQ